MTDERIKRLEHAARAAFARGDNWSQFFPDMAPAIRAAEPHDRRKYHRLVDRLLCLLVSGNDAGHRPVGDDAPWETDDRADAEPDDVTTAANIGTTYPPGSRGPSERPLRPGNSRTTERTHSYYL